MTNKNPQKTSIRIEFPLGLLGFEEIHAGNLVENRNFCIHRIPIFNLSSEDDSFQMDVLQTNFSYYSADIRYFIRRANPMTESDSTIFIPLCTQKTPSGLRIMGNLRTPLILSKTSLRAYQIILTETNLTMNGHLFTIHETNTLRCGLYDG